MIKMLTGVASAEFAFAPNDNVDVFSDKEERSFVDAGLAEYVTAKPVAKVAKKKTKKIKR